MEKWTEEWEKLWKDRQDKGKQLRKEGRNEYSHRNFSEAANKFKEALKLEKTWRNYHYLGLTLVVLNQIDKATNYLKIAVQLNVYTDERIGKVVKLFYLSPYSHQNEPIEEFKLMKTIEPNSSLLPFILGNFYIKKSSFEEATKEFYESKRLGLNSIELNKYLAYSLDELKRYKESIEVYRELIQLDPNDIYIIDCLGHALFNSRQYKEAIYHFKLVLQIDPTSIIHNTIGDVYYETEEYEEALNYYLKAYQIEPNDTYYIHNIAHSLYKLRKYEEGMDWYSKTTEKNHYYYQFLGKSFMQLGRYDNAIENLNISLEIRPNYHTSLITLCLVFIKKKEYEKALEIIIKSFQKEKKGFLYFNHGYALYKCSKFHSSIQEFDIGIKILIENDKYKVLHELYYYYAMGLIKLGENKYEEILAKFNLSIKEKNSWSKPFYKRGLFLIHLLQSSLLPLSLSSLSKEEIIKMIKIDFNTALECNHLSCPFDRISDAKIQKIHQILLTL